MIRIIDIKLHKFKDIITTKLSLESQNHLICDVLELVYKSFYAECEGNLKWVSLNRAEDSHRYRNCSCDSDWRQDSRITMKLGYEKKNQQKLRGCRTFCSLSSKGQSQFLIALHNLLNCCATATQIMLIFNSIIVFFCRKPTKGGLHLGPNNYIFNP